MVFGNEAAMPFALRTPRLGWVGPVPLPVEPAPKVVQALSTPVAERPSALFRGCVKRRLDLPWPEIAEGERQRALDKWRLIAAENPGASELGRHLKEAGDNSAEGAVIIKDTFEGKATNT